MERFAWKGRIKPGMQEEYKRRHDAIWPEMLALLKEAGIRNYTIWSDGSDVFGYYECEKGIAFAEKTQAESPIVDKWNDYMQDVLELGGECRMNSPGTAAGNWQWRMAPDAITPALATKLKKITYTYRRCEK